MVRTELSEIIFVTVPCERMRNRQPDDGIANRCRETRAVTDRAYIINSRPLSSCSGLPER